MIPNTEKILTDYLNDHDAIQALGAKAVSRTPRSTGDPWICINQLDPRAADGGDADYLIAALFQLDCYAGNDSGVEGGQEEASLLMRTVRAALVEMKGDQGDAVVSVVRFGPCPRLPDTDFEPALERYALEATIYIHP